MKNEDCSYGACRVIIVTVEGTCIGRHTQENELAH